MSEFDAMQEATLEVADSSTFDEIMDCTVEGYPNDTDGAVVQSSEQKELVSRDAGALSRVYYAEPRDDRRIRRNFMRLVNDMKRMIDQLMAPLCLEHGITTQQYRILVELDIQDGQSSGEVSERLDILRPNFSVNCRKLSDLGYLTRERGHIDHRQTILHITPAGSAVVQEIENVIIGVFDSNMVSADKETFERIIVGIDAMRNLVGGVKLTPKTS